MREMSVPEQRYQAVLAVIKDGRTVKDVAGQWSVSRQTVHGWLAKYEAGGLAGLSRRIAPSTLLSAPDAGSGRGCTG
jgi:transposase-like protein